MQNTVPMTNCQTCGARIPQVADVCFNCGKFTKSSMECSEAITLPYQAEMPPNILTQKYPLETDLQTKLLIGMIVTVAIFTIVVLVSMHLNSSKLSLLIIKT